MNITGTKLFPRVSYGFASLGDARLITFVRNMITLLGALTVQYKTPMPALSLLTDAVNAFELAVQAALNGGKIEIGARKAARAFLLSLVRQEAAYVQGNCSDDVQNIIETGFAAVRGPSPAGQPAAAGKSALGIHRPERPVAVLLSPGDQRPELFRANRAKRRGAMDGSPALDLGARGSDGSHARQSGLGARPRERLCRPERMGWPGERNGSLRFRRKIGMPRTSASSRGISGCCRRCRGRVKASLTRLEAGSEAAFYAVSPAGKMGIAADTPWICGRHGRLYSCFDRAHLPCPNAPPHFRLFSRCAPVSLPAEAPQF